MRICRVIHLTCSPFNVGSNDDFDQAPVQQPSAEWAFVDTHEIWDYSLCACAGADGAAGL